MTKRFPAITAPFPELAPVKDLSPYDRAVALVAISKFLRDHVALHTEDIPENTLSDEDYEEITARNAPFTAKAVDFFEEFFDVTACSKADREAFHEAIKTFSEEDKEVVDMAAAFLANNKDCSEVVDLLAYKRQRPPEAVRDVLGEVAEALGLTREQIVVL